MTDLYEGFNDFVDNLPDAEEPKLNIERLCKNCLWFKALDLPNLLIEGVGDCKLWEEVMDPTDTCDEWEKNKKKEALK